jgi:hypothetical protein
MQHSDRRRLVIAAVFTTLALPALWVANAERGAEPSLGAAGLPAPAAGAPDTDSTYVPEGPVFLDQDGITAEELASTAAAPVQTPAAPAANEVRAMASFKRLGDIGACGTNVALAGTTLTVENVDNGRIVTCRAVLGVTVPDGVAVVLDTALMAQLTDLSEAPIPVRVSW